MHVQYCITPELRKTSARWLPSAIVNIPLLNVTIKGAGFHPLFKSIFIFLVILSHISLYSKYSISFSGPHVRLSMCNSISKGSIQYLFCFFNPSKSPLFLLSDNKKQKRYWIEPFEMELH